MIRIFTDAETAYVIDRYTVDFVSSAKIAKELSTGANQILKLLRDNDIQIRQKGCRQEKAICEACGKEFSSYIGGQGKSTRVCEICVPNRSWYARYLTYQITKPVFDAMLEKQSGMCDLCDTSLPTNVTEICVDHCHEQGHVRGLIHQRCNKGLGFIENDKFLANAVRYIERHRK